MLRGRLLDFVKREAACNYLDEKHFWAKQQFLKDTEMEKHLEHAGAKTKKVEGMAWLKLYWLGNGVRL